MGLIRQQHGGHGMLYTKGELLVRLTVLNIQGPLEDRVVTFAIHGLGNFHRLTLAAHNRIFEISEGISVEIANTYTKDLTDYLRKNKRYDA